MTLNLEKCKFAKEKVALLGYVISKRKMESNLIPKKVGAITHTKALANVSELRRFLGMVNQMGKYTVPAQPSPYQQAPKRSSYQGQCLDVGQSSERCIQRDKEAVSFNTSSSNL